MFLFDIGYSLALDALRFIFCVLPLYRSIMGRILVPSLPCVSRRQMPRCGYTSCIFVAGSLKL